MPNSILKNPSAPQSQNTGFNPEIFKQIQQFAKTVKGNPKEQVMNMVRQGLRSNEQLQQAMDMARQIQNMFK